MKQLFFFSFLLTSWILSSQEHDCLAFKGKGETYDKMRLDTRATLLFFFTDEKMKTYLKGKDLMTTHASLTYLENGFYILNLDLELAIANALQLYGYIPVRGQIVFHFLDDSQVKLRINKKVEGIFDEKEKTYLYQLEYPLDANALKQLKVKELDELSITWSSGKETYEIYDVDVLIRQFRCLEKYQ
ncbi:MAG: hypothetical protein AAGG68_13560 [Bacteroidota bacterium]